MDSNRHDGDKSTIKKAHKRKHKKLSPETSPSKRSKHDIHNEDKKTDSEIIYKRETDVPVVPKTKKKKTKKDETPIVVYFDLETTGLDVVKESLTQIAAQCDDQTFSVYIRPRGPIGPWALKNTHLSYDSISLTLYYKGKKVTSKEPQDALKDFVDFLKSFSRQIILAAHFCHQFDAQILYKQLVDHHLWEDFSSIVNGFADTCLMFQRLKPSLKKHKLDDLASKFLPDERYSLHNAVDDTRILKSLVEKQGKVDMLLNDFFQTCLQTKQYFPKGRAVLRFR